MFNLLKYKGVPAKGIEKVGHFLIESWNRTILMKQRITN